MNTVPNIISTKDLLYLEDLFKMSLVSAKKAFHFANEVKSEEVKEALNKVGNMFQNHCKKITEIITEGVQNEQQN